MSERNIIPKVYVHVHVITVSWLILCWICVVRGTMASNVTPTAYTSGGGIRTKTVVIHSVKSDVTVESLRATLALDADPVVTTHTKISLSSDNDTDVGVRSAQITTLDSLVPHLLALDGKTVDGRPWAVTKVPPDASSHVESDPVVPEYCSPG